MTKRLVIFVLTVSMALLVASMSASGEEHEPLPEHAHMLLLNAELNFASFQLSYDQCIDLANNRRLRLNAHHEHLHFGESGVSFGGASGNVVIPADGFPEIPWTDCATLALIVPPNETD